jgi:hypothetical protein
MGALQPVSRYGFEGTVEVVSVEDCHFTNRLLSFGDCYAGCIRARLGLWMKAGGVDGWAFYLCPISDLSIKRAQCRLGS